MTDVTNVTEVTDVTDVIDVTHFAPSAFPANTSGRILLIINLLLLVSSRRKLKGSLIISKIIFTSQTNSCFCD